MRREHLIAVAAGTLGALLFVALLHGSVLGLVVGLMLSPMPLAMTALGFGLAYLPLAILSGVVAVAVLTGSFAFAAIYAVIDVAPVAILTRIGFLAERRGDETGPVALGGPVLGWTAVTLSVTAVMVMAAALIALPAGPEGLEATLRHQFQELLSQMDLKTAAPGAAIAPEALAATMARVAPGSAAWEWALRALVGTALGQWLLARDGFARWPTPAYRTIAVPGWYIGVAGLVLVAGWLAPRDAGFVAANAAIVLSLPLVLQGLAVVHTAIAQFGLGRIAVVVFYGFVLVTASATLVLIAILGVMEHFLHMRMRLMARPRNGGE